MGKSLALYMGGIIIAALKLPRLRLWGRTQRVEAEDFPCHQKKSLSLCVISTFHFHNEIYNVSQIILGVESISLVKVKCDTFAKRENRLFVVLV